jgi:hypothetical protein
LNHHSTTFSNDGRTLVLDDEVYTGVCAGGTQEMTARCGSTTSPMPLSGRVGLVPATQAERRPLLLRAGSNVVPLPTGRDIVVTGWFGGGMNLVDFTDRTQPEEIALCVSTEPEGGHSFSATKTGSIPTLTALGYSSGKHPARTHLASIRRAYFIARWR